ncbi:UNVERIFIED_CONTAM: hypothetical protein Sradi_3837100 [Sesamum radiatum]|uniref:Retrotransposon gag domain-containing protein n=1 Tax=Sesamum radiatum TaxID=300843 RepID=A0AAW2Q142_SESRA
MADELLMNYRTPAIAEYDGTSDPMQHLSRFENAALLHRYTNGIKCRVFVTTFARAVQQWFNQLPAGAIRSFQEFRSLFLHQFASSRRLRKTELSLFVIRQKDNEPLKEYLQRFNTAALEEYVCWEKLGTRDPIKNERETTPRRLGRPAQNGPSRKEQGKHQEPVSSKKYIAVVVGLITTPRGSTGESPFSLVYGTEAIIPAELGTPSHRVMNFAEECNKDLLKENLDLIEELREKAFIWMQRYKSTMINSYNKRVKTRSFQVGDLVLRRTDALKPVEKLDPTWEGPYKITAIIGRGAYELEDLDSHPLLRPWNIHNLNRYMCRVLPKDERITLLEEGKI